jgi:uncharacterized damage-inducible protein DinB
MAHQYLEGTLMGLTDPQYNWFPNGKPASIAGQYAHLVTSEDWLVNVKAGNSVPVMAASHTGRTGFETPPPPTGWDQWTHQNRVDLAALRNYAQAVYQATDAYLASITDDELSRPVDMSEVSMGQQTVSSILGLALLNNALHCGEISCLKGLQGLTGYPVPQDETAAVA